MKKIHISLILASVLFCFSANGQAQEMKTIPFSSLNGVSVGNAQNDKASKGVTVFRFTEPGRAAVEVFGGGPARSIVPVFTTADGDTVYAVSIGPDEEKVPASIDAVGAISAKLIEAAIADAIHSSQIPEKEYLKKVSH